MNTINAELTDNEKLLLIELFYDLYFNTNQRTSEFSREFYHLTKDIMKGNIPLQLNNLVDYSDSVIKAVPRLKSFFREVYYVVNELKLFTCNQFEIGHNCHGVYTDFNKAKIAAKTIFKIACTKIENPEININDDCTKLYACDEDGYNKITITIDILDKDDKEL